MILQIAPIFLTFWELLFWSHWMRPIPSEPKKWGLFTMLYSTKKIDWSQWQHCNAFDPKKWILFTEVVGLIFPIPPPEVLFAPVPFFSRKNFKILIFDFFFSFWLGRCHLPSKLRSNGNLRKSFSLEKKEWGQAILTGREEINPTISVSF